ncbi:hypothetical protein ACS8E2_03435 [Psychrobacter glaciei]
MATNHDHLGSLFSIIAIIAIIAITDDNSMLIIRFDYSNIQ